MFTIFVVWGYFLTLNSSTDTNSGVHQNACRLRSFIAPLYLNAPINVKPAKGAGGGSRAWGGDLIVFVGPGVGHLTDLVLPGEDIFESIFARREDI